MLNFPNALILPVAGRIRHIFHISDLHIRTGDRHKARYHEYQTVLQRFVKTLADWPVQQRDAAVTIITGDLFHHKLKVESAGLDLLLDFLNQLTLWTPVYILRGNHDYRQESPDEMDMLSPLLLKTGLSQKVCYLDRTGHYVAGDVGFGLVTVQDALIAGAASGRIESLPPFPPAAALNEGYHPHENLFAKIALFHGTVEPAAPAIAAKQCVPLSWFGEGYDAILLGDIHLQQVRQVYKHNVASTDGCKHQTSMQPDNMPYATCIESGLTWRIRDPMTGATIACSQPWGYAGSLVQQHFGEPLIGHGFLHWNLEACTVDRYHIFNDCGWMTLKEDAAAIDRPLLDHPAFPKSHLHIRMRDTIEATHKTLLQELQDRQQKYGLCLHTYTLLRTMGSGTDAGADGTKSMEAANMDEFSMHTVCNIHDPSSWCQFIEEKGGCVAGGDKEDKGDAWKAFFQKEQWKKSLLPEDDSVKSVLPDHVLGKIRERNAKIEKLYANYESSPETALASAMGGATAAMNGSSGSYKLLGISWSYLLCYGEQCQFRFDAVPSDSIIAMNGRNGHGKTSFLEVLCLAVFGEGFPSRLTKQGSIIHHAKPASASAWSRIEIAIPKDSAAHSYDTYILQRDFTTASKPKQAILMRCNPDGEGLMAEEADKVLHRGKTAVDAWVRQTLGTLDGFLMGGMMTQHEDRDFFSLKPLEQRDLLDRALGMHASTRFVDWLKEARLGHAYVLDLVQALLQDVKKSQMLSDTEANRIQQECEEIRGSLESLRTEEVQEDARLQECMQRLDADPEWLQKGRNALESMLASLPPLLPTTDPMDTHTEQSLMDTLAMLRTKWSGYDPKELQQAAATWDREQELALPPTCTKSDATADWKRYSAWARKQNTIEATGEAAEEEEKLRACEERLDALMETQRRLQDADQIPEKPSCTLRECNVTCDALVKIYGSIDILLQNVRVLEMHEAARVETLPMTEEAYRQATEQIKKLGDSVTETPRDENTGIIHRCLALLRDIQPWMHQRMGMAAGGGAAQKAAATKKVMDRLTDFFAGLKEDNDKDSVWEPNWADVLACVRTGTWRVSYDKMTECLADLEQTRTDLQRHRMDLQRWTDAMAMAAKAQVFEDWQQNVKRVRSDIETQQVMVKQLHETVAWIKERTQMEALGRDAREALDAIAVWERQEACRAWRQHQDVEAQLKHLRIREHASKALACMDVWEEIREIRARLDQCRKEVTGMQKKLGILTERWERHVAVSTKHARLDTLVKQIHSNMLQLAHVTQWMESGYKAWAYQHQIIPMIGQRVNAVMRAFQANTPASEHLVFDPDVVDTTTPMMLQWGLCMGGGGPRIPLEKASGFQRFLVRLAMRIVLGHLHVGDMVRRPCQLFLDEGFTACDAMHLANVPTFLRCLLSMYDQIVLVSHLEEVREQTDFQVRIQMHADGFSYVA